MNCSTPGSSVLQFLLRKFMSIKLMMLAIHLILCCPLLLLPSVFPGIRVFPVSWLFTSCGQNIRASASVLRMNTQDWFPLGLTGLISLQSKGLSIVFSSTVIKKHQFFSTQPFLWSNSHIYMTTGETIALTIQTFLSQVTSLLFKTL